MTRGTNSTKVVP
jgi:porphobilinogen deaminase